MKLHKFTSVGNRRDKVHKSESVLLQEAFSDEEEVYMLIFDMTQVVLSVQCLSSFKSICCGTTSSPLLVKVRTAGDSSKWGRFIRVLLSSSHSVKPLRRCVKDGGFCVIFSLRWIKSCMFLLERALN